MRTITRSRGAVAGFIAGVAFAITLAGCTPGVPGESNDAAAGGGGGGGGDSSLTILLSDTVDTIDPTLAMSAGGRQTTWLVYEPLVRIDPATGESAPGIASEWEFTATTASFTIREGVMCADGSEITAGTVARNFERWKDPETNAPLVNNFFGSSDFTVESDDEAGTVEVEMTTPSPFRSADPRSFTTLGIVCDSGLEDPDSLRTGSDGTGPYSVDEYVTGSHVTLVRNDDYDWAPIDDFDVTELPATVNLQIVGDPNTQSNMLISGEADAALLGIDQLRRFESEEGFTQQFSDTSVSMLMFNERDGYPTQESAVRIALAQSIDFAELADVATSGLGYAADFLRAPDNLCVDQESIAAAIPSGGVEAGRATLEEAGWTQNADGIYQKDGDRLTLTFLQFELTDPAVSYAAAAWKELGAVVEVDNRSPQQAVDVLYSGTGWTLGFVGMQTTTPTGFRPFFVGPAAPEGPNFGAVANEKYAQLQGKASTMEGTKGCELWEQAEAAVVANADWVPAIATDTNWVLAKGVSFFNVGAFVDPLTLRN